jgi:hypothetical protein
MLQRKKAGGLAYNGALELSTIMFEVTPSLRAIGM